jgi:hypothetical protein
MNAMNFIAWMFPVIFMLHDFEEIIMAEVWSKRYHKRINRVWPKRQPFGLSEIREWQSPTFAAGVGIEFILFSLVSFFSVISQNYFLWFSVFCALLIHMVFVHILICFWFKGYVPGVVTSVLLILPGAWFLCRAADLLKFEWEIILPATLVGIILLALLIPALHKLMGFLSIWLNEYSETQGVD